MIGVSVNHRYLTGEGIREAGAFSVCLPGPDLIEAAAHDTGQALRELRLFDRYAGKGVETGFKSLAMALILQDETRTLTDRDVEAAVTEVVAALKLDHGAVIRS